MAQGGIDHASYLARQQLNLGKTTVGASTTTQLMQFPASNVRIRAVTAMVAVAGTAGATVAVFAIGTGTTFTSTSSTTFTTTATLGTATVSTSAAGTVFTVASDANLTINSGGRLVAITGTDATMQCQLSAEAYVDPLSSWTGN